MLTKNADASVHATIEQLLKFKKHSVKQTKYFTRFFRDISMVNLDLAM